MALRAKLEDVVPTTLPDDFDEWDGGEAAPATLPDDFDEFDDTPAPPAGSAAPQAVVVTPAVNTPAEVPARRAPAAPPVHAMPSPAHAATPALKRTQELPIVRGPAVIPQATLVQPAVSRPAHAAGAQAQPAKYATTEELSSLVRDYRATRDEESDGERQRKKKLMLMWIGAGVLVLAIVAAVVALVLHKPAEPKKAVVVVQPTVTYTPDATPFQEKATPSTPAQSTTEPSAPAPQPEDPVVQSEMMSNQLSAPARISKDVKSAEQDASPPPASFGTGGLEGLGATGSPVSADFGKQPGPKVKSETPRIATISAGVAQGMLLQKTSASYPPIAKTARVSGTVVLQATISKTGQIENLKVLSGPSMLQKAAVDAVRNWRYKPYMLDNQPVDVETTVNVVFALGG
ncbi:MAG: TonB family protein [Terracidiphilus sp.]